MYHIFKKIFTKPEAKEAIKKGFNNGIAEGGVHAHTLDRTSLQTRRDGAHFHLFVVGTKEGLAQLITETDGAHPHILFHATDSKTSSGESSHGHKVTIPFNMELRDGTVLKKGTNFNTEIDGEHNHGSDMLDSTNFDAGHKHKLRLSKETVIFSMDVGQWWELFGPLDERGLPPIKDSTVIASALDKENRDMEAKGLKKKKIYKLEGKTIGEDQLLALAALGYEVEAHEPELLEKAMKLIPELVTFVKTDDDKQIVMGVVLEPEEIDAQKDILSKEEIEQAAHGFLAKSSIIGIGHLRKSTAKPVESYIAPEDFTIKKGVFGKQTVKKGSWVMAVHVPDAQEWADVKSGKFTGFSIGGFGTRSPDA